MSQQAVSGGDWGGQGGNPFNDQHMLGKRVAEIQVRAGSWLDGLTVTYSDGSSVSHGGMGGAHNVFRLQPGEYIAAVSGSASNVVDRLEFVTNTGRRSGVFGQGGQGGRPFSTNAPPNHCLAYVSGRAGTYIDHLGFHFVPAGVVLGGEVGGQGGNPFNDEQLASGKQITAVTVCAGSWIDGLRVTYSDGSFAHHGGNGGGEYVFSLQPGEYIVAVSGSASNVVDRLEFVTNTGRRSGVFGQGGQGGRPFSINAPPNHRLVFFSGRAGAYLDRINCYFAPIPKVVSGGDFGGQGGNPFSDEQYLLRTIAEIQVRAGSWLDGLTVTYSDGSSVSHGGMGGAHNVFRLQPGEYIAAVSGSASNVVDRLEFVTNTGRRSGVFGQGGQGGRPFSTNAPPNHRLVYFSGRAGTYIDHLGFHFVPIY